MRDLINIIKTLSEGSNLAPGEFKGRPQRWETFITKIRNNEPFTTVDDQLVTLKSSEADRFVDLWNQGKFIGNKEAAYAMLAQPIDGEDKIALSKLKKTTEFGGAGVAVGGAPTSGGKASYALTPQAIGIVDRDIPASDLYNIIANNSVLKSTDHGKIVIDLANYIVSGEAVVVSEEVRKNSKLLAAIQDNAGEYLGVLALLYHRTRFPARASFEKWLGGSIDDLILRFPSAANYALADSFATITNPQTSHSVNISSKGKDGGAAPSIRGLKIPEHIEKNPKLRNAVKFVKLCKEKDTITQALEGLDLLYKHNPKSIDEMWHKVLPMSKDSALLPRLKYSLAGKAVVFDSKWKRIIASVASKEASEGGKIIYAAKREVADAINNKNALPEFKDMILEILEMNFVQQYTDFEKKHIGEFTFETQWPAKLDGEVTLENKSSAKEPTSGGFSFKLGRTDASVSDEPGEPAVDDGFDVEEPVRKPGEKLKVVGKEVEKEKSDTEKDQDAGRRRRR